jgi:hypothetical protein
MTQDRVDSGSLDITHDFLATMLGTDRPTVSLAAGVLQRKKLIEYTRGAVKIVNRKKLEKAACECYGVIRQYDGELGLIPEVKTRPCALIAESKMLLLINGHFTSNGFRGYLCDGDHFLLKRELEKTARRRSRTWRSSSSIPSRLRKNGVLDLDSLQSR